MQRFSNHIPDANRRGRWIVFGLAGSTGLIFGYSVAAILENSTAGHRIMEHGEVRGAAPDTRIASGLSYTNCAAARAAGAAPVHSGDRGYSKRLDRDGDGVGCE